MRIILGSAALAIAYMAFMLYAGLPDGHSARFNYAWIIGYSEAFQAGALLPRFLPTLNGGMGGFDFFFYGPLPFWLTSVFAEPLCLDCAVETPFIVTMTSLSILGSCGVYLLCRRFFPPVPSASAAVLYAVLPYHFWVDWFFRQAAAEYAAYAFLPFILLGMEQLRQEKRGGGTIVFGVLGTVLCHLPTALLAAHVFGILALAIIFHASTPYQERLYLIGRYVAWAILGVLLGAFYWFPALLLLPRVSIDILYRDYLTATSWLIGPQTGWFLRTEAYSVDPETVLYNGIAFVIAAIICTLAIFVTRGILRLLILLPLVFALFMNTFLSAFIWDRWIIDAVQFPWRLFVFVDLATALAIAAIVSSIINNRLKTVAIAPLVIMVTSTAAMIHYSFAAGHLPGQPNRYDKGYAPAEYISPERQAAMADIQKALPAITDIADAEDFAFNVVARDHEIARTGTYSDYHITHRSVRLRPNPAAERVLAPLQYWFLWHAQTADGTALEIAANPNFGTVDILPPPAGFDGELITLELRYHWSEWAGALISALAAIGLFLICLLRWRRLRPAVRART